MFWFIHIAEFAMFALLAMLCWRVGALARETRQKPSKTIFGASDAAPPLVGEKLTLIPPSRSGDTETKADRKQKVLKHYIDDYLN
jgi:hypothetical protein